MKFRIETTILKVIIISSHLDCDFITNDKEHEDRWKKYEYTEERLHTCFQTCTVIFQK